MEKGRYPIRGIDETLERVKNLYKRRERERGKKKPRRRMVGKKHKQFGGRAISIQLNGSGGDDLNAWWIRGLDAFADFQGTICSTNSRANHEISSD